MPTIAIIDGIMILVYRDDHDPPHFHVRHSGRVGKFEIATVRQISGNLDRRTIRKVQQWTISHQDLLMEAWMQNQTTGKTVTTKS